MAEQICCKIKAVLVIAVVVGAEIQHVKHDLSFNSSTSSQWGRRTGGNHAKVWMDKIHAARADVNLDEYAQALNNMQVAPSFHETGTCVADRILLALSATISFKHAHVVDHIVGRTSERRLLRNADLDYTSLGKESHVAKSEQEDDSSQRQVLLEEGRSQEKTTKRASPRKKWWSVAGVSSSSKASPFTHNVVQGLAAGGLYCLGYGLFRDTVLPSFIAYVGGNNRRVGYAEGLQGVTMMASAIPVGYLADKWSRSACIRSGCVLSVISILCLMTAVYVAQKQSVHAYMLICASLAIEGIVDGVVYGPIVALMADSTPGGQRGDVETFNTVMYEIASAVGPLLGLVVLLVQGDDWTPAAMKSVIAVGLVIGLASNVPCWLMDDKKALGVESEAAHLQGNEEPDTENDDSKNRQVGCCGLITPSLVPYVMFVVDLIMGLGAGMTIKFFPIFFQKEVKMSPAGVQSMFSGLSALTILGTLVTNGLSKRFGRVQVALPCIVASVACMFLIGALKGSYTLSWVMVPLFMLRCTLMWSVNALQASIVDDYTPKATRGRWKSLTSVSSMAFSGSAVLGGWIIDHYGYSPCFMLTACFQTFSLPLLASLWRVVALESDIADTRLANITDQHSVGIRITPRQTPRHSIRS